MGKHFDPEELYRVITTEDATKLALYVRETASDVSWFDLSRERRFGKPEYDDREGGVKITDDTGRSFILEPMTLEDYHANVRKEIDGEPEFKTRAAMVKFFKGVQGRMYGSG